MSFLSGGFAAGGGADALEQILAQEFAKQIERRRAMEAQQRLGLDEKRLQLDTDYKNAMLDDRNEARMAATQAGAASRADRLADDLTPGMELDTATEGALKAGDRGNLVKGPTLGSTNIGGDLLKGRLMMTPNPGKGPTFTGTAGQLRVKADAEEKQRQFEQTRLDREAAAKTAQEGREDLVKLAASLRPPAQSSTRYNVVQGSDANGKPALIRTNVESGQVEVLPMPEGVNFAKREQPATQDQTNLGLYANRVEQADPILTKLQPSVAGMNVLSFEAQTRADNPKLQSAEIQSYMQAARNFINAVLRRESGAVISPEEFREARKQYLPAPGDTADVLQQKAQNRRVVFDNFKRGAGPAYKPLSSGTGTGGGSVIKSITQIGG